MESIKQEQQLIRRLLPSIARLSLQWFIICFWYYICSVLALPDRLNPLQVLISSSMTIPKGEGSSGLTPSSPRNFCPTRTEVEKIHVIHLKYMQYMPTGIFFFVRPFPPNKILDGTIFASK
jgi:hypothetical protein